MQNNILVLVEMNEKARKKKKRKTNRLLGARLLARSIVTPLNLKCLLPP